MVSLVKVGIQPNTNVYEFIGLSTDKKPEKATNGSLFYEMDTRKNFIFDEENNLWRKNFNDTESAVSSNEQMLENIKNGNDITFTNNSIALEGSKTAREDRIVFENDSYVDFQNKKVSIPATLNTNGKNWSAFYVEVGANVVFDGTKGGIIITGETSPEVDGPYCITNFGGTITIKGGEYKSHGTVIYGYEGTIIIEGGYFEASPIKMSGHKDQPWTLNLLNDAWKEGKANFIVKGGTFVNFDPSHPNTDDADSYVAKGYKVVQEKKDENTTLYKVVKE